DIEMVNAAIVVSCQRDSPNRRQSLIVAGGVLAARCVPVFEVLELDAQYCCLQCIKSTILSHHIVMVLLLRTPVAQHPKFLVVIGVIGDDAAGIAIGPEVFSGIKAERSNVTQDSCPMFSDCGTVGLRGIFDDAKPAPASDRANGPHIATLSIEVDRYDGARS